MEYGQSATPLIELLQKAQEQMTHRMMPDESAAHRWDRVHRLMEWARALDAIIEGLREDGSTPSVPASVGASAKTAESPQDAELPRYEVEGDRLVKTGRSRDGGTYEHRVTQKNFNLVVEELVRISQKQANFETVNLSNQCDIPRHEPLVVLAVLAEYTLLINVRKGRWAFVNASTFASDVQRVWPAIPRKSSKAAAWLAKRGIDPAKLDNLLASIRAKGGKT